MTTIPLQVGFADPEFAERVLRAAAIIILAYRNADAVGGLEHDEDPRRFRAHAALNLAADVQDLDSAVLDLQSLQVAVHTLIHDVAQLCSVECQCKRNPTMGRPSSVGGHN